MDERVDNHLLKGFRAGDIRALARAISLVERRDPSVRALEEAPRKKGSIAPVVGFTGAPGTGKSTLVDALVALLRKQDKSVAVIATDPNSPFTGGAILGDRIRMQRHALDQKVSQAQHELAWLCPNLGTDQLTTDLVGWLQMDAEIKRLGGASESAESQS